MIVIFRDGPRVTAFSILKRIVVGETVSHCADCNFWDAFSILKRIVVGETLSLPLAAL